MQKPKKHLFVCASFRLTGNAQGACNRKGSPTLLQYLEQEVADRGIEAAVSSTGCLKACDRGPIMVVYPDNVWYGKVDSEDAVDAILDGLESGTPAEAYLLA
jgi:(2Fe-2S) ferredoxin